MSLSRKYALLGVVALFALQWLWHGLLLPATSAAPWIIASLFSLPLLPSLLLHLLRRPSAQFWGGVAALLYFCHGIAEAWTVAQARPLAWVELSLAVWTIVAGNWDGIKARLSKRDKPPANV